MLLRQNVKIFPYLKTSTRSFTSDCYKVLTLETLPKNSK